MNVGLLHLSKAASASGNGGGHSRWLLGLWLYCLLGETRRHNKAGLARQRAGAWLRGVTRPHDSIYVAILARGDSGGGRGGRGGERLPALFLTRARRLHRRFSLAVSLAALRWLRLEL
eukprot:COSAG01_NODE_17_length_39991_cov_30.596160_32_plen_118_part_00